MSGASPAGAATLASCRTVTRCAESPAEKIVSVVLRGKVRVLGLTTTVISMFLLPESGETEAQLVPEALLMRQLALEEMTNVCDPPLAPKDRALVDGVTYGGGGLAACTAVRAW